MSNEEKQNKAFEELIELSEKIGLYDHTEFDEKRFKANCWLLNTLAELVNQHKELRFGQILEIYGFVRDAKYTDESVDLPFWRREVGTEPQVLVERVEKRIAELNK